MMREEETIMKKNNATTVSIKTSMMDRLATANRASITLMTTLKKIMACEECPDKYKKDINAMLLETKSINKITSKFLSETID